MTQALAAPRIDPSDAAAAALRFGAAAPADLSYAVLDTPAGRVVAAATTRGLVRLAYEDWNGGVDRIVEALAASISPRILEQPTALDAVARELDEYFAGRRRSFDLTLDWRLSAGFRATVLQHLADIEYGHTASYATVARLAGRPKAFRAVGTACSTNPLPVVVPCHRVVKSDGSMGGYLGGSKAKATLLELEMAA